MSELSTPRPPKHFLAECSADPPDEVPVFELHRPGLLNSNNPGSKKQEKSDSERAHGSPQNLPQIVVHEVWYSVACVSGQRRVQALL